MCACTCTHAFEKERAREKVLIVGTERLMGAMLRAIVSHSTVSQGTLFMHGATYAADRHTLHTSRDTGRLCMHVPVCI